MTLKQYFIAELGIALNFPPITEGSATKQQGPEDSWWPTIVL